VDKITDLLGGDHGTAQEVVAELDSNPLTIFTELLLKEEQKQKGDPNVVANICSK
jgi:hypothetical protein